MDRVAIIAYGDGGELGSFKIFAEDLHRELSGKYAKVNTAYANRGFQIFKMIDAVEAATEQIAEMHIYSHAIGAGLFLGYKDPSLAAARKALVDAATQANKRVTFRQVMGVEVGALTTDDLDFGPFVENRASYQSKFAPDAFVKIWGCNSGAKGWVYSDLHASDPADTSVPYYWRALNEVNSPKPAFAAVFARFLGRTVYGASSGASMQVKHNQTWINTKAFKQQVGHWPSGSLPHRLLPEKSAYTAFEP